MTSFDDPQAEERVLDDLLEALAEAEIERQVTAPIDAVAADYAERVGPVASRDEFFDTIAEVVRIINGRALRFSVTLPRPVACAEGLRLLEESSFPAGGRGWVAAFLLAGDSSGEGIRLVLALLVERIKIIEVQTYTQWILSTRYETLDWGSRVAVTRALLERMRGFLPQPLGTCTPEQLVHDFPALLRLHLHTDSVISRILAAS